MIKAIILAAGESSRFWPLNSRHKTLIKIMGRPLIFYLISGIAKAGIKEIIIVQQKKRDIEKELKKYQKSLNALRLKYIIQPEPLGAGDAILRAGKFIKEEQFFVLNAEKIEAKEYIKPILNYNSSSQKEKNKLVLLAEKTATPWLFGILRVRGDKVLDVIEKPKKCREPSNLKIVGIYYLPKVFLSYLKRVPRRHYSFEAALSLYAREREIRAIITPKKTLSLKFPWDLFEIEEYLFDKFLKKKIGKGSKISKRAVIEGKVEIGKNVKILEAVIKGPCYIGDNSTIGTNALVREYTNLEENTLIGGFAEVKKSIFQENVHVHAGFFGDSIFDRNCQVGAGTVTANLRFDREKIKVKIKDEKISTNLKHLGAILGENTKVGVNSSLMPGIIIGRDCIIGPHSLVMKNIEDGKVFYSKNG